MYREIRRKKALLESRAPFKAEVAAEISKMNLEDMVYTSLRLSGSALSREKIKSMLNGNIIREASISEHMALERYRSLQEEMANQIEMGSSLNLRTLLLLYSIITDSKGEDAYRKNDPFIHELSYTPPHYWDVPEQMDILMKWMSRDDEEFAGKELMKAAYFHNRLVEIYPFREKNREIARVGLYYYIMSKGYPVFNFNFSEIEYNKAIEAYLKKEDIGPLYSGVERSLFNKLDMMLMMTTGDNN